MTGSYYVTDAETSIKNRGEEAIGNFKAHPMHPDNNVVLASIKRENSAHTEMYPFIPKPPDDCTLLVGHNIGFDLLYYYRDTQWREWSKTGRIWDTMLAEYLLTGQDSKFASLDKCALKYGGSVKNSKIKEYWENDIDTEDIPTEELQLYLLEDIRNTELVFLAQMDKAHELDMLDLIDSQMEARLATIEMEWNGMFFDRTHAEVDKSHLLMIKAGLQLTIDQFFNDNLPEGFVSTTASNKTLGAILFGGTLKYDVTEEVKDDDGEVILYKTGKKAGQPRTRKVAKVFDLDGLIEEPNTYSTQRASGMWCVDDSVLKSIVESAHTGHLPEELAEIADTVLQYRGLEKDIKTYYEGYGKLCWPTDNCIHPNFNHVRTNTGRLSSSNPNMQNSSHNKE